MTMWRDGYSGYGLVRYKNKYGFIDTTGAVVIPLKCDDVYCGMIYYYGGTEIDKSYTTALLYYNMTTIHAIASVGCTNMVKVLIKILIKRYNGMKKVAVVKIPKNA